MRVEILEPEQEKKNYGPGKSSCLLVSSLFSVPLHPLKDGLFGNKHSCHLQGEDFFLQIILAKRVPGVHFPKASGSVRKATAGVSVQHVL